MKKFKFPSLQHMVRQWRDTPEAVRDVLLQFTKRSPSFSYACLGEAIRDLFILKVDYDQVVQGIETREKRSFVRDNLLQLLPLIYGHFVNIHPDFIVEVAPQYYAIARNLMIPFRPPTLYGVGGRLVLPWFIFWKNNPLDHRQNSLFVTLVSEMLRNNPDLSNAELQILDFSAPRHSLNRTLRVTRLTDYEILSIAERNKMLQVFADGFSLAAQEFEHQNKEAANLDKRSINDSDPKQHDISFPK